MVSGGLYKVVCLFLGEVCYSSKEGSWLGSMVFFPVRLKAT